jgi:hypothetical protein
MSSSHIRFVWTNDGTVWDGTFNDHYIASWGLKAPQNELRGTIGHAIFAGLPPQYYVELRLLPVHPPAEPLF